MTVGPRYKGWEYDQANSRMNVRYNGTRVGSFTATAHEVPDGILLGLGNGQTARFSWGTADANANMLKLQMPAGGSVDVPVLMVGQSIEAVDLALYDGVVDPRVALLGVGAVTTGPGLDFRKARGTAAAPTVVTSGDDVGTIRGYAAVAAGEWVQTAEIRMDCAGTIATTRGPGTITFLTATDAAPSVLTQAMIISAAQLVTMASAAVTADLKLNLTLTAGADGVGSSGEQLTSGGAAAETNWAAAGSMREFKEDLTERRDADAVLQQIVSTPVYDFKYKRKDPNGPRILSTGDTDTTYTGIVADEAPWAMHYGGRVFNPVNAFGHSVLAIKALEARLAKLEKGKKAA